METTFGKEVSFYHSGEFTGYVQIQDAKIDDDGVHILFSDMKRLVDAYYAREAFLADDDALDYTPEHSRPDNWVEE